VKVGKLPAMRMLSKELLLEIMDVCRALFFAISFDLIIGAQALAVFMAGTKFGVYPRGTHA
jgi:hypothetical protein